MPEMELKELSLHHCGTDAELEGEAFSLASKGSFRQRCSGAFQVSGEESSDGVHRRSHLYAKIDLRL